MKVIFTCAAIAAILFACKKEDFQQQQSATEQNAAANAPEPQVRIVNNHLNYPWEILWGPDNYIWFTQREGTINRINPVTGEVTLVKHIEEVASTTPYNGLLGMVLHPDFTNNPYVYVVYNYWGANHIYLEKVVRYTYDGTTLISPKTIINGIKGRSGGDYIHNGSRLVIGPDMKLYVTTGDANRREIFPQNHRFLNGKILRANLDGTIPDDNPWGNVVWAIGQRNPQGLVYANGMLYSSMHGESTNDEINIIEKGGNYGWPYVEGYCDLPKEKTFCAENNVIEPIYAWTPTIAPSGLDYYNNDAIPRWKNSLLLAVLKDEELIQLKLNNTGTAIESEHEYFKGRFGRMRDVAISPDGVVYICTDNGNNADMIIEVRNK